MPSLMHGDVSLHYDDTASALPTLVLSHGYLLHAGMFDGLVARLAPHFRCVRFDHRSHGRSSHPARPTSMEELCADALAVLDAVAPGPVHFLGMSAGGFVGLRLALRHPERFRSLTLLDTSAEAESPRARRRQRAMQLVSLMGGARLLAPRILKLMFSEAFLQAPEHAQERERWRSALRQVSPAQRHFGEAIFSRASIVEELPRLRVPTLVVVGDADRALPRWHSERLARDIRGATLQVIPRAGHCAVIEQPGNVAECLTAFLRSLPPVASEGPSERGPR